MQKQLPLLIICSLLISLSAPVFAQEAPAESSPEEINAEIEEDEVVEEDPELPDEMLVLPEEDPNFKPDPNQLPLEEDPLLMPQTRSPFYWRVEARESLGWTSNVDQIAGGQGSLFNRLSLTGIARYTFPTQTQLLARTQGILFNNFNVSERDQFAAIPLSLTASQWFFDQLNVYAGYLPILSSSLNRADGNVQRFDNDFLFGATYFQPIGDNYLFGGYQADYFLAELSDFQYLSSLLFVGYRHSFTNDHYLFADARFQPRGYLATDEMLDEMRFGAGLAYQWHILKPWLILELRGDYNQIINFTQAERSTPIFSFGVNLISAIQS